MSHKLDTVLKAAGPRENRPRREGGLSPGESIAIRALMLTSINWVKRNSTSAASAVAASSDRFPRPSDSATSYSKFNEVRSSLSVGFERRNAIFVAIFSSRWPEFTYFNTGFGPDSRREWYDWHNMSQQPIRGTWKMLIRDAAEMLVVVHASASGSRRRSAREGCCPFPLPDRSPLYPRALTRVRSV
jgi:hypothetical protein